MRFSEGRILLTYSYSICFATVTVYKDLFDTKLKFLYHCEYMTNKALQIFEFVRRNAAQLLDGSVMIFYAQLIWVILFYASQMWSPFYHTYIDEMEETEHKFFNYVALKLGLTLPGVLHDYRQIMSRLNITTL